MMGRAETAAWLIDPEGCVICANAAAEHLLGQGTQSLVGRDISEMLWAEDPAHFRSVLCDVLQTQQQSGTIEGAFCRDDGMAEKVCCKLNAVPPDGKTRAVLVLAQASDDSEAGQSARVANKRLETVAANIPGGLFEYRWTPDRRTSFSYFSDKFAELLGVSAEALEQGGEAVFANIPAEDAEAIQAGLATSRKTLSLFELRHRVMHPRKGLCWLNVWASPVREPDGSVVWFGKSVDITDRLHMERRVAEAAAEVARAHRQLTTISNMVEVGLFEFRELSDGTTDFAFANDHFCDLIGVERHAINGLKDGLRPLVVADDAQDFAAGKEVSARDLSPWTMRFRIHHPSRGEIWLSGSSVPRREDDGTLIWAGALSDVTEHVRREEDLQRAHARSEEKRADNEQLALHDELTGLPNRRYYEREVAKRAKDGGSGVGEQCSAVIRIDLDHFKQINDTLGHEAGDQVLQHVAEILRGSMRLVDFAARIGGDEFSVLVGPSTAGDDARKIAEQVRARLGEPFACQGFPISLSASFGIAHDAEMSDPNDDLQTCADVALYHAKETGRNRIESHSERLRSGLRFSRRVAAELEHALEQGEFVPYFLPQLRAEDGSLAGVEIVTRWRHPIKGLTAWCDFASAAEQLGIRADIDRMMIDKAMSALAYWRQTGLCVPRISLNVGSATLNRPEIVSAAGHLATGSTEVSFGLAESVLVGDTREVFKSHLNKVHAAGLGLEIDDFGSGYASILAVMEIAPSVLKIDEKIVASVAEDQKARETVHRIIDLANTLGIRALAKGVETKPQASTLSAIGCHEFQGGLFAQALSETELPAFCRGRERITA
ncbi:EAL domain-containing protein [Rhodovulum sp. P5]|uniref:sensor domain-containing protein n=1 Tax=Rhodovulum sp. P5 TaxID=1564506 RepID=UPI0015603F9B|nr:EAL domain-containing protein [Rhodovulum sp. P5]